MIIMIIYTGSDTLSAGDIEKINCLYGCEGTCGGHISGEEGVLQSSGSIPFTTSGTNKKVCKWLLSASSGDAIELSFENFNVDCGTGQVCMLYSAALQQSRLVCYNNDSAALSRLVF